jgi:hypothetical protein
VQTYNLDADARKALNRKLLFRALFRAPIWIAFGLLLFSPFLRKLSMPTALLFIVMATVCACVAQWLLLSEETKRYSVLVDEDAICTLTRAGAKSVRRGKVCTIRESESGLYLSEQIGWRAKLGGSVWVPRELHQYGHLKDLAVSWKTTSQA